MATRCYPNPLHCLGNRRFPPGPRKVVAGGGDHLFVRQVTEVPPLFSRKGERRKIDPFVNIVEVDLGLSLGLDEVLVFREKLQVRIGCGRDIVCLIDPCSDLRLHLQDPAYAQSVFAVKLLCTPLHVLLPHRVCFCAGNLPTRCFAESRLAGVAVADARTVRTETEARQIEVIEVVALKVLFHNGVDETLQIAGYGAGDEELDGMGYEKKRLAVTVTHKPLGVVLVYGARRSCHVDAGADLYPVLMDSLYELPQDIPFA